MIGLGVGEFDQVAGTGHENPWNSSELHLGVIDNDEHRALAWRAAVSSIVLLENDAGVLALPIGGHAGTIAVLGEGANDWHAIVNRYTGTQKRTVALLAGIHNRAATDGTEVRHSEGDTTIAIGASVVVVVVRSEDEGESHDRANLTMRAIDQELLLRLHQQHQQSAADAGRRPPAASAKVVVISGGPVDTSQPVSVMSSGFVTSVIAVWQPGEEGGNALAALGRRRLLGRLGGDRLSSELHSGPRHCQHLTGRPRLPLPPRPITAAVPFRLRPVLQRLVEAFSELGGTTGRSAHHRAQCQRPTSAASAWP